MEPIMDALRIQGGAPLRGELHISGSKNATLPIMAAALLSQGQSTLRGTPDLVDVRTLGKVLAHMGMTVRHLGGHLRKGLPAAGRVSVGRRHGR